MKTVAEISSWFTHLIDQRASDLHLRVGSVPFVRVNGRLLPSDLPKVTHEQTDTLIQELLPPERMEAYHSTGEADFAIGYPGVGRFRVNVMRQRSTASVSIRRVLTTPPSFDALGLPSPVHQLAENKEGLVLVTGPRNSGKSTTVASMIDHINEQQTAHIICIEQPVEMLFPDKKSIINQREVGIDTPDHRSGLQQALRHDPEVLYIDQIHDSETMSLVLSSATVNLVVGVLPTTNAVETVDYILDFFPERRAGSIRRQLGSVLQGVISQRLIARSDGRGRIGAFEFMIMTSAVRSAIVQMPGANSLESVIETGDYYGMHTLDQHLAVLNQGGMISLRDALAAAVNPNELRIALQHGTS